MTSQAMKQFTVKVVVQTGFTEDAQACPSLHTQQRVSLKCPVTVCTIIMQTVYKQEITELKEKINILTSKIMQLLESLQGHQEGPKQNSQPTTVTGAIQASPSNSNSSKASPTVHPAKVNTTLSDGRKYNIELYGLKECAKGTSRSDRLKQELEQVTEILTGIEKSVSPQSR